MTQVRLPDSSTLLARPPGPLAPRVERGLRVAAGTLCHASPDLITSTTVVVDLGADDLDGLEQLVHDIGNTYAVESVIYPHVGWCAVHFSHRTMMCAADGNPGR